MSAIENVEAKSVMGVKGMVRVLIGAVVGAGVGAGFVWLLKAVHAAPSAMRWSDPLAMWLGVTFVGIGLALYAVSFNRRELARNLEGDTAKLPATDQEVRVSRLQCLTMLLAGVMLLLPLVAAGSWGGLPGARGLTFVAIVILFVLQTVANVRLWRSSDEFLRGQLLMTGAVTFGIGEAALFLWAAAEHLQLVSAISSWDIITLLMTVYVAAGSYIALRTRLRG